MKFTYKVLIGITIFIFAYTFYMKSLFALTDYSPAEKDGYCNLVYGDNSNFYKPNKCSIVNEYIDREDLESVCIKPKLFSLQFTSNCFKEGHYNGD